ncbi:glucose 1-dehydrogenase [Paralimibaculum aggregatum]|uniref:Glucose 1-dehydrogenase n=1 Tax=Paralimibaculum aggregatum TaxID=3036245 RepID=A0ABQ6LNH4_9RHOB|nr:SDR family oxidoreductase [Limibaculum sp. NKW23]GMG84552.1 glucose 1-dehydrogenase [Limibaculum sp. NKW23]
MAGIPDLFDLGGRVALVTGASSGIGRTLAVTLAGAGAAVVALARREDRLADTVAQIEAAGGRGSAMSADLAAWADMDDLAGRARAPFGAPDILVNAAGLNFRQPWDAVTPESWSSTIGLNLSAPFFLARALVPDMQERGWGRVINIASVQAVRAMPDSIPYGASKGGVAQLTRAMAEAWSRFGICCNSLAPGYFPTEMTADLYRDSALMARNAERTAVHRNGELGDMVGPALFLASPASDYVTGQMLFVDGGFTAK